MKLARWDPLRDVDEFFDRAMGWPLRRQIQGTLPALDENWVPRVNISETDKHFLINAEIPGIKREDVKIDIEDNVLTIHGERKEEKEEKGRKFHRVECSYGSFSRSFTLPQNTQMDHIEATFKDGILNLEIPKKQPEKSKLIEVKIH